MAMPLNRRIFLVNRRVQTLFERMILENLSADFFVTVGRLVVDISTAVFGLIDGLNRALNRRSRLNWLSDQ